MEYVLWFVVGMVIAVLWLLFGTRTRCPSCGLEMVDSLVERMDYYAKGRVDSCPYCGWKRNG